MVRVYKRISTCQSWVEESMLNAINAVNNDEMSYTEASSTYNVPRSTLQDRVKKVKAGKIELYQSASKGLGFYKRVFNNEQEKCLVEYLKQMESRLFGLTQINFRKLAFELAERNKIQHMFNQNIGLADRIYNVDESGLSNVAKSRAKIIARKGRKQVGKLSSSERGQNVTVTICISASGNFIQPLMIFPRLNPDFGNGAPPATLVTCHPSGWMQSDIFVQWLEHFIKHAHPTKTNPVLLLLDGHATHVKNLNVIDMARQNHVIILCFPPHTTHRLQPLDVSFMGPLSTYYSQQLDYWLLNHPGRIVGLHQISAIFGEAYMKAATVKNACSGFHRTGIFPFNPNVFDESDFAAAETTNITKTVEPIEIDENPTSFTVSSVTNVSESETETVKPIEIDEKPTSYTVSSVTDVSESETKTVEPIVFAGPSTYYVVEPEYAFNNVQGEPSTSYIVTSSVFNVSPEIIQPIPSVNRQNCRSTNRRRGKTAIITESPYKNELTVQQNIVKQKVNRNLFVQKPKKHTRKLAKYKSKEDENVMCLYCNELYSASTSGEKWIKCTSCANWLHELCGGADNWKDYICDFCKD